MTMMNTSTQIDKVSSQEELQPSIAANPSKVAAVGKGLRDQAVQNSFPQGERTGDEDVWDTYFGASDLLVKALRLGRIRGVVGMFAQNERLFEHELVCTSIAKDLIQRDILVVVAGDITMEMNRAGLIRKDAIDLAGDGLAEFCDNLGVQPILAIGCGENPSRFRDFCSLLARNAGANDHDFPVAAIVRECCQDETDVLGLYDIAGNPVSYMDADPDEIGDLIDGYIHEKRLNLAWCDRYHCSICS